MTGLMKSGTIRMDMMGRGRGTSWSSESARPRPSRNSIVTLATVKIAVTTIE